MIDKRYYEKLGGFAYLLGELIYFFLYGGVVIPRSFKPFLTLCAVAPLALQDFSGKLVDRFTGALLRSDEGREACSFFNVASAFALTLKAPT